MLNDYFLRKHFCVCLICLVLTVVEKEESFWCRNGNLKLAKRRRKGKTSANNSKIGEKPKEIAGTSWKAAPPGSPS